MLHSQNLTRVYESTLDKSDSKFTDNLFQFILREKLQTVVHQMQTQIL